MTIVQSTSLILLSGAISIDRLAGFNIMISRPFIVSGVVGYLFDNMLICLFVGVLFELIGMLEVPVGTLIVHDDTFGGYAMSVMVCIMPSIANTLSLVVCVAVVLLFMYPVTQTDKYCRAINQKLIATTIKADKQDFESMLINIGLATAFARGVLVYNTALVGIYFIMLYVTIHVKDASTPTASLLLLYAFLGGYLFRFLSREIFFKLALFSCGLVVGWLFI